MGKSSSVKDEDMVKTGMEDVVALTSNISGIDGETGKLEYRGYSIHDLARHSSYEETAFLLLNGYLPNKRELDEFSLELREKRRIPPEVIGLLTTLPNVTHPMVSLRTAISFCGSLDEKLHLIDPEENLKKSKNLLAMIPTIIAYCYRIREKKQLVHSRDDLGHAANFIWMLKGEEPDPIEVNALDTDLILHAEHTLNASTYASRIAASTLSDMYAGVVSATGTLMGSLHGGATQAVMGMLKDINASGLSPRDWIDKILGERGKIPGFGHRVYKTGDPRASELKKLASKLHDLKSDNNWFPISEEIAEIVKERTGLHPNVDFYATSVYANLNIPEKFFITIFAMARIVGWTTHMMEQYQENKLIRPLLKYIGKENREYILIEDR